MKILKSKWLVIIAFILGCLASTIFNNYEYFVFKKEIEIFDFSLGIITLVVAIYIADTIQRNLNTKQHQFSYLQNKIDSVWIDFHKLSTSIILNKKTTLKDISIFKKNILPQIDFIKSIFISFNFKIEELNKLENSIDELETLFERFEIKNNVVYFNEDDTNLVKQNVENINKHFSIILNNIIN